MLSVRGVLYTSHFRAQNGAPPAIGAEAQGARDGKRRQPERQREQRQRRGMGAIIRQLTHPIRPVKWTRKAMGRRKARTTINFDIPMPPAFKTQEDPDMKAKVERSQLLAPETEMLEIAAKGCLGDTTMQHLLEKLFGTKSSIVVGSSYLITVESPTKMTLDNDRLADLLLGLSFEKVIIPVNAHGNHLCAIMSDVSARILYTYE
ncbi:hypothetical protein PInf_008748 [Phytophthora infestans]|nr:hypothetical protein PInf_008748 [Phytophthora infestans]